MKTGIGEQLTLDQIIINQSYTPTFKDIFAKVKPLIIMITQSLEDAIPRAKEFFETQNKLKWYDLKIVTAITPGSKELVIIHGKYKNRESKYK